MSVDLSILYPLTAAPLSLLGAVQSSLISAPIRLVAVRFVGASGAPNVVSDALVLAALVPLTLIVLIR